jgi:hypothetical protein
LYVLFYKIVTLPHISRLIIARQNDIIFANLSNKVDGVLADAVEPLSKPEPAHL